METIYNKSEAARALKISVETLNRYKKKNKLYFHKIGDRIIFTESDLIKTLENFAVYPTELLTEREKMAIARIHGGSVI